MLPLLITYLPTQLARVVESGNVAPPSTNHAPGIIDILHSKWDIASQLVAFQFSGWPHTHVPSGVVVIPALALAILAARRAPRLIAWLVLALAVYAVAGIAGVFPIGYRWGLIMTPLIICAIATGLAAAMATRAKWAMIAAFALLIATSVYSLPNRTLRDRVYEDQTGAWPETEDMRMVAGYWMQHRSADQPTYVYYGAAPAFAYYTRAVAPRVGLPSTWHLACWHDGEPPSFCHEDGIYYGRWMRRMDANAKIASMIETLGGAPDSFWIVFGHLVPGDDREMIDGFKREGYLVRAAVEGVNASACLLARER
jgi:hypothetical protein